MKIKKFGGLRGEPLGERVMEALARSLDCDCFTLFGVRNDTAGFCLIAKAAIRGRLPPFSYR